ncbi:MAG: hypothetical protein ABEI52_12490 [Halobacteriaceae archaeon]
MKWEIVRGIFATLVFLLFIGLSVTTTGFTQPGSAASTPSISTAIQQIEHHTQELTQVRTLEASLIDETVGIGLGIVTGLLIGGIGSYTMFGRKL